MSSRLILIESYTEQVWVRFDASSRCCHGSVRSNRLEAGVRTRRLILEGFGYSSGPLRADREWYERRRAEIDVGGEGGGTNREIRSISSPRFPSSSSLESLLLSLDTRRDRS